MPLLSGCGGSDEAPVVGLDANTVGGIESITVDGKRYFFGFSYRSDLVLSPLMASEDAMADYALAHITQTDGRHDHAFWVAMAQASIRESGLTDTPGQSIALAPLKAAVAELRRDPVTVRKLLGLAMPEHLYYLLYTNCVWPDEPTPPAVEQAALRLGLEADDISPWMEESAAALTGATPLPKGAEFQDAAMVYLWIYDEMVGHQRHGWAKALGLERR